MKKESNEEDSEEHNSKITKDNPEESEIKEDWIEQEDSEEELEIELEEDLDEGEDKKDIEEDEETEEESEDDGEIKFNHWLNSSNMAIRSIRSSSQLSELEKSNVNFSKGLEQGLAFAPRVKDSKEGKKYSGSKYDSSKYNADFVKTYTEQTPGKNSETNGSEKE